MALGAKLCAVQRDLSLAMQYQEKVTKGEYQKN
jgi:hypothetical protein